MPAKKYIKYFSSTTRIDSRKANGMSEKINYLHPNIGDMTILSFYHNLSCICYWLLHTNK